MLQNIKLSIIIIRRFHSVSSARKREKNNELFVKHLGRGGVLQISRNRVYCKLITIIQCHSHTCTLINERIKLFSECSPAIPLLSYCNFNCMTECPCRSTSLPVSNNVSEGKVVQFLTNIVTAVCFSAHAAFCEYRSVAHIGKW